MKKVLAAIIIALLATSCLFAFVGCNKDDGYSGNSGNDGAISSGGLGSGELGSGDDDTAKILVNSVSKETYSSVEDAVKAFLKDEISGQTYIAEYVGYRIIVQLSQDEIDNLTIEEGQTSGIIGVEKGEVEYIQKENSQDIEMLAELSTESDKREVYVIAYNSNGQTEFRYAVPNEEIGQTMSMSALSSIFDFTKYINCTVEFLYELADIFYIYADNAIRIYAVNISNSEYISENKIYYFIVDGKYYAAMELEDGSWEIHG
nr:hypothetical protein [Clostridia bacterium]